MEPNPHPKTIGVIEPSPEPPKPLDPVLAGYLELAKLRSDEHLSPEIRRKLEKYEELRRTFGYGLAVMTNKALEAAGKTPAFAKSAIEATAGATVKVVESVLNATASAIGKVMNHGKK